MLTETDVRDLLDYDMIVELAVAAACAVIVTHNVRDFRGPERFGIVTEEKMSALMTEEVLAARATGGSRQRFDAVLAKVPEVEPDEMDRLSGRSRSTSTAPGARAKWR